MSSQISISIPPPRSSKVPCNICPNCGSPQPCTLHCCGKCDTRLISPSRGAVSFWIMGEIPPREVSALAKSVESALGIPVIVQPGLLDPKPSVRRNWKGRSGTTVLNQLLQRHTPGTLTNVGIIADNIVSDSATNWLYGYAYVGWQAACMSLYPLKWDSPSPDTLTRRARSVCLHEIGHNLDLPDHPGNSGIDCCMIGEVSGLDHFEDAAYPINFCSSCYGTARQRLLDFESGTEFFLPAAGKVFAGRYELVAVAGEGGMGVVWKAHDLEMGHDVALKFVSGLVFKGSAQVALRREVANLRRLSHSSVIRVFDLARDSGSGAIVMDWIDGKNLDELLQAQPRRLFDPMELVPWMEQLCGALDHSHRMGIIHKDVKPHNCLINRSGALLLSDFGIASPSTYALGSTGVFQSGEKGTHGFSPPEQFAGGQTPGRQQDIYALGATFLYLLTGKTAHELTEFSGRVSAINEVRSRIWSAHSPVSPEWEMVIWRCLSANPAKRPASVSEVIKGLGLRALPTTEIPRRPASGNRIKQWLLRMFTK